MVALVAASASALAATTYTYTGPKFQFIGGAGYTSNLSVTGSFTTTNPLPPNLALTDIGPAGTNLVTAWSFNDGVNTYTKSNSIVFGNLSGYFRVATNAFGNLTQFYITLLGPLPPHAINQSMRFLDVINANFLQSQGGNGAACQTLTGSVCTKVGNATNYGDAASPGAFAPVSFPLDVDLSVTATRYDALTDGILVLRYLFGITGPSLTAGALGATATRTDPVAIKAYLDSIRPALDLDGNGQADALTDGLMILRYLFGLKGASLIQNAIAPNAPVNTAPAIESQIAPMTP